MSERAWIADGFVLRTPLRPIEALHELTAGLGIDFAPCGDRDTLATLIRASRAELRARMVARLEDPVVAESVYLGSPGALRALRARSADRRRTRTDRTLWGYLTRMGARPTPFGTFAGWSVGTFADRTRLEVPAQATWRRSTRLDTSLVDAVARDPSVGWSEDTSLRASPSYYLLRGRVHYLRAGVGQVGRLVAVPASDERIAVLSSARAGAKAGRLIATAAELLGDTERARELIADMVDRELLVPIGAVPATGDDPCADVIDGLRSRPGGKPLAASLAAAVEALTALDAEGLGASPERYERILDAFKTTAHDDAARAAKNAGSSYSMRQRAASGARVQVELIKDGRRPALGPPVLEALEACLDVLLRVDLDDRGDVLKDFRSEFAERYEHREVRLVEALDPESGIKLELNHDAPSMTGRDSYLLRRLQGTSLGEELELEPDELARFAPREPRLPDALALVFALAGSSEREIDTGHFEIVAPSAHGPPATRLLGRFCSVDAELHELVRAQIRREEELDPEAIYAELATSSAAYIQSLMQRPVLRGYEVEYGGLSGAPAPHRLHIGDLRLALDARNRFTLRCARRNRRVEMRSSTAFNFLHLPGPPISRFLVALEAEGRRRSLHWRWGILAQASWLPRVRVGRFVLTLARWRLEPGWENGDEVDRFRALAAWRERLAVPRHVRMLEGNDKRLWIDLESPLCQDHLASRTTKLGPLLFEEAYPPSEREPVHGPEGRYVHQVIVPLARSPEPSAPPPELEPAVAARQPSLNVAADSQQSFIPGSSWLTAKLYCAPAIADDVLRQIVTPLRQELIEAGPLEQLHFLRYADPRSHLRVRLYGKDPVMVASLGLPALARVAQPAIEDGRIWRLQFDTYLRELERYGGTRATELTERLWDADSAAVLTGLEHVRSAERRWLLALAGVHMLLDDNGLDLRARLDLVGVWRRGLGAALGAGSAEAQALAVDLRAQRGQISEAIDATSKGGSEPLLALARRAEVAAEVYAELGRLDRAERLAQPLFSLLGDHVHLHVNRMLRGGDRWHELRLYDALERHYAGALARARPARSRAGTVPGRSPDPR